VILLCQQSETPAEIPGFSNEAKAG